MDNVFLLSLTVFVFPLIRLSLTYLAVDFSAVNSLDRVFRLISQRLVLVLFVGVIF